MNIPGGKVKWKRFYQKELDNQQELKSHKSVGYRKWIFFSKSFGQTSGVMVVGKTMRKFPPLTPFVIQYDTLWYKKYAK